ncbi:odorant receptor 45a-like [Bactrocera neohumeralis]|uniref:odorant receptor 45a-like n=1 Tax=Bactrocera neohumeralis TaxID=98809 RepID=UPI002166B20E|nr:odorant receptor 45a-like [Bactrocera neohumeralis]
MFKSDLGITGYFHLQKFTFHRLGIDMTTRNARVTKTYFLTLQIIALATILIPIAVYSWQHIQEIVEVTNAMAPFMQATISLWKIWRVIYRRKEMAQMAEHIYLISTKASAKELTHLKQENNRERLMNTAYYYSVLNTGMLALAAPVLVSFIQYLRLGEFSYIVVLKATYPIDYARPLNYFLIWLWTAVAIYGVIYGSVSVDSLYSWYIHNLVGNFKILQSKLVTAESASDLSERRELIYYCIAYHQRIIAMTEQLNIIYQPIVFVQFSLNALQICFLAYQIGSGVVDTVDLPFLFLFMISVGIQLMIYCYGGQHLQNESVNVSKSIYQTINSSSWPNELRKVLLISMMRAQKPSKLTGIFFDVDLPLFLWVWRTAGSYVTLLRSVDQKTM